MKFFVSSLAVPVQHSALATDFLLQLNHAIHQSLRSGRAARHIHVHGDNAIATTHYRLPFNNERAQSVSVMSISDQVVDLEY